VLVDHGVWRAEVVPAFRGRERSELSGQWRWLSEGVGDEQGIAASMRKGRGWRDIDLSILSPAYGDPTTCTTKGRQHGEREPSLHFAACRSQSR